MLFLVVGCSRPPNLAPDGVGALPVVMVGSSAPLFLCTHGVEHCFLERFRRLPCLKRTYAIPEVGERLPLVRGLLRRD